MVQGVGCFPRPPPSAPSAAQEASERRGENLNILRYFSIENGSRQSLDRVFVSKLVRQRHAEEDLCLHASGGRKTARGDIRSEEHTSELQSR